MSHFRQSFDWVKKIGWSSEPYLSCYFSWTTMHINDYITLWVNLKRENNNTWQLVTTFWSNNCVANGLWTETCSFWIYSGMSKANRIEQREKVRNKKHLPSYATGILWFILKDYEWFIGLCLKSQFMYLKTSCGILRLLCEREREFCFVNPCVELLHLSLSIWSNPRFDG